MKRFAYGWRNYWLHLWIPQARYENFILCTFAYRNARCYYILSVHTLPKFLRTNIFSFRRRQVIEYYRLMKEHIPPPRSLARPQVIWMFAVRPFAPQVILTKSNFLSVTFTKISFSPQVIRARKLSGPASCTEREVHTHEKLVFFGNNTIVKMSSCFYTTHTQMI